MNTLDKSTETLIEEAVERFNKKFVKNQNGFEVVQPLHIDEFEAFLKKELSTIASKSAEVERKKTFIEVGQLFPEEGGSPERQQIMRRFYQYFKEQL